MSGVRIIVDTGPEVEGVDRGCHLSDKHAKKLSDTLWKWYFSTRGQLRGCMKTIHAFPDNSIHPGIKIEVLLTGTYTRYAREKPHEERTWSSSFFWKIHHQLEYQIDRLYTPNFCRGLPEKLTELLKEDLGKEIEAFQKGQEEVGILLDWLKGDRQLKVA